MSLHYISDAKGRQTAVVIPIDEWNRLTTQYQDLKALETPKKKPSDFVGCISEETAQRMITDIDESRLGMGTNYLIDTNTLLEYLAGSLPAAAHAFMGRIVDDVFNVSVINRIEVLGHESATQQLTDFMDLANTLPLSEAIVEQTIVLRKIRKTKLPDAIIAATALVHGLTIISRNIKDFQNIIGLDYLNPHDIQ